MNNPWKLYDELIAGVPTGIAMRDYHMGNHWLFRYVDKPAAHDDKRVVAVVLRTIVEEPERLVQPAAKTPSTRTPSISSFATSRSSQRVFPVCMFPVRE